MSNEKHRILIVEDHAVVREGIKRILETESDLAVCGESEDREGTLDAIRLNKPDVLLLDLSLRNCDGLDLIKEIRAEFGDLPILVLSMHDESIYSERVLHAGARGYIMKQEGADQVVHGIREVLKGNIFVGDRTRQRVLRDVVGRTPTRNISLTDIFSDRELQVFRLMGKGFGTGKIAEQLLLSVKTVETYQAYIKAKLNLDGTAQLRRIAVDWVQNNSAT